MKYEFSAYESERITKEFGESFYQKVVEALRIYRSRWKLSELKLIHYFSVNCLFYCTSERYGDCVLKICDNSKKETAAEIRSLLEYRGKRHCAIYDADPDNQVLLLQRIKPGEPLKERPLAQRLEVFAELFNGLHIIPANAGLYVHYADNVDYMTEYMRNHKLYGYFLKARAVFNDLQSVYHRKMLLHGDLHFDNVLLDDHGEYTIIDPQAVIGDPIFDIPRYLLKEFEEVDAEKIAGSRKEHMLDIVRTLSPLVNVPADVMLKCFFIDVVMVRYWEVVFDNEPSYGDIEFAESLLP